MLPRARHGALPVVAAALIAFGTACGGAQDAPRRGATTRPGISAVPPTPRASTLNAPKCRFPAKLPFPEWVPDDLPLPRGTYASQLLPSSLGYRRAIFVVPGTLQNLARFVVSEWPKRGWQLGRGESEPGEIEDQFVRPPAAGAFKAQEQFCRPGYSLFLLIYIKDRSKITLPSTQPRSPLAPSPSTTP